jgi:hypothetical protein
MSDGTKVVQLSTPHTEVKKGLGPEIAVVDSADLHGQFSSHESTDWGTASRVDWYEGTLRHAGSTFMLLLR